MSGRKISVRDSRYGAGPVPVQKWKSLFRTRRYRMLAPNAALPDDYNRDSPASNAQITDARPRAMLTTMKSGRSMTTEIEASTIAI